MTTSDDRAIDGTGEPPVGRGSAFRGDLGATAEEPLVAVGPGGAGGDDDPGHGSSTPSTRPVPRPSLSRPARERLFSRAAASLPSARFALGVALVVGLGVAWVAVGSVGSGGAAPVIEPSTSLPLHPATTAVRPAPAPVERAVAVPRWVPASIAATCDARASAPSSIVVSCTPGRGVVRLQYRAFVSVGALRAAYVSESSQKGGVGPPACAHGAAEERAWSTAGAPTVPVGRYRCSITGGRARIVWTSERVDVGGVAGLGVAVLGIATRADTDLRSLYRWWATVPGPTASGPTDR